MCVMVVIAFVVLFFVGFQFAVKLDTKAGGGSRVWVYGFCFFGLPAFVIACGTTLTATGCSLGSDGDCYTDYSRPSSPVTTCR